MIAHAKAVTAEADRILAEIDRRIRASLGVDTSGPSTLNDLNDLVYELPWLERAVRRRRRDK